MRIAVVDVGTNTTRLYIAEVTDGVISTELTRLSRVTRLGAGVDRSGKLAPSALEREYAVLSEYRDYVATTPVDRAVAVMTSAVRDASNGSDLAATVTRDFGFDARVLTGEQEARLTYLGAVSAHDHDAPTPDAAGPTLVVDIGGGSTEVVLGHGRSVDFHVSIQAGVVRHADRHITSDPPSDAELAALAADVRSALEAGVPPQRRGNVGRAIGVAGTPTVLAAIAQSLDPYDPARVHGYQLAAVQRDTIFTQLKSLPLAQRQQVRGLHPDRANVILPGIVILIEAMSLFGLDAIEVSEHDILHGAALTYAQVD